MAAQIASFAARSLSVTSDLTACTGAPPIHRAGPACQADDPEDAARREPARSAMASSDAAAADGIVVVVRAGDASECVTSGTAGQGDVKTLERGLGTGLPDDRLPENEPRWPRLGADAEQPPSSYVLRQEAASARATKSINSVDTISSGLPLHQWINAVMSVEMPPCSAPGALNMKEPSGATILPWVS